MSASNLKIMLSVSDARDVALLLTSAQATSPRFAERMDHLLHGLSRLLDLKLATGGRMRVPTGKALTPEVLEGRQVGHMSPDEQAALMEFFANMPAAGDLHLQRCVPLMNGQPLAVRRSDVVGDEEWYASEQVQKYRKRGGVDDQMLTAVFTPDPTIYYAFGLHRAWGKPLFSDRDRAIALLTMTSIDWLFDGLRAELHGQELLSSVSPRLLHTLAALLRGDSEKQAARRLGVSPHTVHEYVKRLHKQLNAKSRGELMSRCHELRITAESVQGQLDRVARRLPAEPPAAAGQGRKV